MNPRLGLPLCLALSACSIAPTPSAYRQRLIDAGIERRAAELAVQDEGTGPAVVLLHGLGGSAYDWRHQREPLVRAGFRVIAPDLSGAGYSGRPADGDYGVPAQAERLLRALDELGVERAHFVGSSYGGGVALTVAVLRPGRVDRLVLIDAAALSQEFPWYVKVARSDLGGLLFAITPKRMLVDIMLGQLVADPASLTEEDREEYAHEHRFDCAGSLEMARALRVSDAERLEPALSGVRSPTLILWGARDGVIPLEKGKILALRIPGSTLEVYPECAHVPHMERPAEVTKRILEFLEAPPGRR